MLSVQLVGMQALYSTHICWPTELAAIDCIEAVPVLDRTAPTLTGYCCIELAPAHAYRARHADLLPCGVGLRLHQDAAVAWDIYGL